MNEIKIKEIFQDENKAKKLTNVISAEELRKTLKIFGLIISGSEALELKRIIDEIKNEFTREERFNLEKVNGGVKDNGDSNESLETKYKGPIQAIGYYASRPTYYVSYGLGKTPIVGLICYNAIKGAIQGLRDTMRGKIQ
ncbi:MAG: hypothetical protein NkDv07_0962 [Candidatus Improbicoccus devescovinae]|nr:MAG: hypothetical protein NkDv07_0962 [Candidatus Improbicoccus devescovinae]